MKRLSAFAAVLTVASTAFAAPTHIYVNVRTGKDSNSGTSESSPFQTLTKAMDKVSNVQNAEGHIVHVAPGTYAPGNSTYHGTDRLNFHIIGEGTADDPVIIDAENKRCCFLIINSNKRGAFSNIIFRNGCSPRGGGIFCQRDWTNSQVSGLTNCVFESCSATNDYGGAVFSHGFSMAAANCVFSNCTAKTGGGAIYCEKITGEHSFSNCTFVGNSSQDTGGALNVSYPDGERELVMYGTVLRDCFFTNNVASKQGGALSAMVWYATNTTFVANRAPTAGVWYYNGYGSQTYAGNYVMTNVFVDCTFDGNAATTGAGCFGATWDKKFVFDQCTFRNNRSDGSHAVFNCVSSCLSVRDCLFKRNTGVGMFYNNSDTGYFEDFRVQFLRSTFCENATGSSPTLHVVPKFRMDGCLFERNEGGNACRMSQNNGRYFTNEVRNCLFACNTNQTGSGVLYAFWTYAEALRLENCTFADNVSKEAPYAVWVDSWCAASVGNSYKNLVFCGNRGLEDETGAQVPAMINTHARNSWFETGSTTITTGTRDCIVGTDPKFVSRATGDYTPLRRSPLRNHGAALGWMTPGSMDAAGNPRVNGERPDIGAYECWIPVPSFYLNVR